jgi:hypothetical protein
MRVAQIHHDVGTARFWSDGGFIPAYFARKVNSVVSFNGASGLTTMEGKVFVVDRIGVMLRLQANGGVP